MDNKDKKKDKKFYMDLYESSTVGFSVVFSILIGGGIGYWIDNKFKTPHHLGFFFFLAVGIIAGFQNMYRGMKKFKSDEDNNKKT
jgi:ATP synthase protein I